MNQAGRKQLSTLIISSFIFCGVSEPRSRAYCLYKRSVKRDKNAKLLISPRSRASFSSSWLTGGTGSLRALAYVHGEGYKDRGQTAKYFCGKAWRVNNNVSDLQKIAITLERSIMFKLCKEAVWGKSLKKT